MNYQIAFLALLLVNLINLHRLNAQYSVGYGLNPYAPQLSPQNNPIVYNIANSADGNDDDERSPPYSTHRPMPLSIWSGTPIVVGNAYGNENSQGSGKQYQHQEYNERSSDRLTPAYLPTNFYNSFLDIQSRRDNIELHQQQQQQQQQRQQQQQHQQQQQQEPLNDVEEEEEEEDVRRQQQVVYTPRATNHNYANVANKLYDNHISHNDNNDDYNRQQLIRGSSRRGSIHGQPEVFSTAVSTTLPSGLVMTSRQIGNHFGRVGAGSYYEPPLPLQLQIEQRANAANYAKHFANYLRKYPQRLQPIYDSNNNILKK